MREITLKALPGEKVTIPQGDDVKATVTCVSLGITGASYELSYFANEVRQSAWFHPSEFDLIS